ncbi:hypothetical protein BH18ACI1_BH18ACI1_20140 [soil metagenome]|nr:hypothetical protein [Acidobacteriota bacterium]
MKKTTTEILIEVEETAVVRMKKQSSADEKDIYEPAVETSVCPFCGQRISETKKLKQKIEE